MTGRQRVAQAFKCQPTDRTPWVPFVGCHAGHLLGVEADEFLQSADHVVAGAAAAAERYAPDGLPVMFDLQLEAETFGCQLAWAKENPPAVTSHPLENGTTLADLHIPAATDGRIALALDATRRMREAHPDLALYGLITGPFTLALHLLGTNIFMKMFDAPKEVHDLMNFCRDVAVATAGYYLDAGCDVIAVVDPMTSQIGPDQFAQFVQPYAAPVFAHIRDRGALSSFFVCGHAQQNVEVMCDCGPDNISVDENIPLDFVRDVCLPRGVSFGGNMQLTTVLLLGSPTDAQRNAIDCIETGGEKGFVLAPGCDLPYAVPPENLQAVAQVVSDPYQRDVVKHLPTEGEQCERLDMREYGQDDKIIIDIITLDSEACAPCQYMVEAVRQVAPEFEDLVEWREHKIKYRQSLVFMTSLMVHNVPTICIDGQIKFVSRIPSRDELIAAVRERLYEKLRMRIRRKPPTLLVLGDGGEQARELLARTEQAVTELGARVEVHLVEDEQEMQAYGVSAAQAPAVVVETSQVKSTRLIPEVAVIKEWIKGL